MTKVNNPPLSVESGISMFPLNHIIESTAIVNCEKAGLRLTLYQIDPNANVYAGTKSDQDLLDKAENLNIPITNAIEIWYKAQYFDKITLPSKVTVRQELYWDGTPIQVINKIEDITPGGGTSKVTDLAGIG